MMLTSTPQRIVKDTGFMRIIMKNKITDYDAIVQQQANTTDKKK